MDATWRAKRHKVDAQSASKKQATTVRAVLKPKAAAKNAAPLTGRSERASSSMSASSREDPFLAPVQSAAFTKAHDENPVVLTPACSSSTTTGQDAGFTAFLGKLGWDMSAGDLSKQAHLVLKDAGIDTSKCISSLQPIVKQHMLTQQVVGSHVQIKFATKDLYHQAQKKVADLKLFDDVGGQLLLTAGGSRKQRRVTQWTIKGGSS